MRYVLLLRGINVGGKNKVVMADLKADLAELGFQNPVSYINSGNLVFDSENREAKITETLTDYFRSTYDFSPPIYPHQRYHAPQGGRPGARLVAG